jgi:ferrochelatase
MDASAPLGLLVMHYGTPASMEAVLPYYTHIRRGNPPSAEQLEDLCSRYRAIGGPSPLNAISERQAQAILNGLRRLGQDAKLYIGAKHAAPFVADAVRQMAGDGIDRAVGVVLAPHYSRTSIGSYIQYARETRDAVRPAMEMSFLERWGAMPEFIDALAANVQTCLDGWNPEETLVMFSAHSLPRRAVADGDPYVPELNETAELVARRLELPHWTFAFQSASSTGEPWVGPDVLDVIGEEAPRYRNLVACTVGFISDHLEVLYDLGIEARDKCAECGLNFRRAACINDDPEVMNALAVRLGELTGP